VQPAAAAAEELARAGYHADSDDEGDALFDFDQNVTSTGGMGFEARVARQQRPQPGLQRPAMQRAQSSIQLSVRRSARGGSFGGDDDEDGDGGVSSARGAKGLPRVSSLSSLRQSAPPGFAAPNRPGPGPFIGGPVSFSPTPSPRTVAPAASSGAGTAHAQSHAQSHLADVSDSDPYPSESDFHDSDINDTGGGLYR
jgi:hypothetical protein